MIVVDLEMSGLNSDKCGLWQIGAVDLETKEIFLEESRIDDEDHVEKEALEITGKTEAELRDHLKQNQKDLMKNFFNWAKTRAKTIICEVPQLDVEFLTKKARDYNLDYPFHHRTFDLHSVAQTRYHQIKGKFLFKQGYSDLGTANILKFVGMEDPRKAHNALEDAKLIAEAFTRIIHGKNLLPEFSKFKIPEYLTN